jgi:hypothetical protein
VFGTFHVRTSIVLVLMMLLAGLSPIGLDSEIRLSDSGRLISEVNSTAFLDGNTSVVLNPDDAEFVDIAHESGHRLVSGSVDLSVSPTQSTSSQSVSLIGQSGLGDMVNLTERPGGLELVDAATGPPGAGLNSVTVWGNLSLNGTHAYNVLEVWGNLTTAASLELVVNMLIVHNGGQITAAGTIATGTSPGGSTNGYGAPGAGGGGHAVAGGDGGGLNAGLGGSRYGNGSEAGSAGGDSTSPYHVNAASGRGGGMITIQAGHIIVNGSITAAGDDGMDGAQASSGTGHGGSGAGGGSGGTVDVRCNALTIGQYGNIRAEGGDGGYGASGAQNGPGIGMFNGGDGGGGGSGGFVLIATLAGGFTNNGITSATGGAGGAYGALYGSGRDGDDGYAGGVGNVNVSSWAGYPVFATAADYGTFTLDKWAPDNGELVDGWVNTSALIPANSSMSMEYRYTVKGNSFTDNHWSDWFEAIAIDQSLPRLIWVQFRWTLQRTGENSSTLAGFDFTYQTWHGIDDLRIDVETHNAFIWGSSLGHQTDFRHVRSSGSLTDVYITSPYSTAIDDLQLWLDWDVDQPGQTITIYGPLGGQLFTTDLNNREEGLDVALNLSGYAPMQPPQVEFQLSIQTTIDIQLDIGHLSLPHRFEIPVTIGPEVTDSLVDACGEWYFGLDDCMTSYTISVNGVTNDSGPRVQNVSVALTNLQLEWIDDIDPRHSNSDVRFEGGIVSDARVLDSVTVTSIDSALEPNLSVTATWAGGIGQAMIWDAGLERYTTVLSTTGFDPHLSHTPSVTIVMTDAHGNSLTVEDATIITLHPSLPQVADLEITPTGNTTLIEGHRWIGGDASFEFAVTDVFGRNNLETGLTLSPANGPEIEMPLIWSASDAAYVASWMTGRNHIGTWTLEVSMREPGVLQGFDADGLQEGVDARVTLVDVEAPILTLFEHPSIVMIGEEFAVNISWMGPQGEAVTGEVELRLDGSLMHLEPIPVTTSGSISLLFETAAYPADFYDLVLNLADASNNSALLFEGIDLEIEITDREWIGGAWAMPTFNQTNITIGGNHLFRTRAGSLDLSVNGNQILDDAPVRDMGWTQEVDLLGQMPGLLFIEATLCDVSTTIVCQEWNTSVNLDPLLAIEVVAHCNAPDREVDLSMNVTIVSCTIRSDSMLPISVSLTLNETIVVLQTSESASFDFVLNSSEIESDVPYIWRFEATNAVQSTETLDEGSTKITIRSDEGASTQSKEDSAGGLIWIIAGIAAVLVAGLLITLRLRLKPGEVIEEVDGIEQLEEAFTPALDAEATSYDELGYEWYSTDDGEHWYRRAGLDDEWTKSEG